MLDAMRVFQRTALFRIAVADRLGSLPLMKVSDRLTDTAELVLDFSLRAARRELVAKYGTPRCGPPLREAGFAVIGYGKLAGLELGYGSDLDLVFLHDSSGAHQETDGAPPLDNERFFSRLVQRLIHFLSIQTSSGRLYDVDTRLRPSGRSGLLVTSLEGFRHYQTQDAWVWEHQALLRSRALAGSPDVCRAFETIRRDVLVAHVDRSKLKSEVAKMRRRMRTELSLAKGGAFDIKQDPGGIADVEFLIDYWVLASSAEYPELVEFPDNIRQLEALERAGLVPAERCRRLKEAYLALRQRVHELALDEGGRVVPAHEFADVREFVRGVWHEVFADVEGADVEGPSESDRRCRGYNPRLVGRGERAVRERHGNVQENLTTANAERVYKVTRADLPLHCPLPSMYLWNSHPKVYLPIEVTGEAKCPYCSSTYRLVEDEAR